MAHNTSYPAKFSDFINRSLFEWLFHPIVNYKHNQINYKNTTHNQTNEAYGKLIFGARYFATLVFTIIPVIPALYILSRLAVIADLRANPLKVFLMSFIPVLLGGIIASTGFNAFVAHVASWAPKALGVLAPVLPAPVFVVMGLLTLVTAVSLYAGKCLAQALNAPRLGGLTSSSKHAVITENENLDTLREKFLLKQKTLKAMLRDHPEQLKLHGEGMIGSRKPTTPIESAKATIDLGKSVLATLEDVIDKDNKGAKVKKPYDSMKGLFYGWKNAATAITFTLGNNSGVKQLDFKSEEEILEKITINPTTQTLNI